MYAAPTVAENSLPAGDALGRKLAALCAGPDHLAKRARDNLRRARMEEAERAKPDPPGKRPRLRPAIQREACSWFDMVGVLHQEGNGLAPSTPGGHPTTSTTGNGNSAQMHQQQQQHIVSDGSYDAVRVAAPRPPRPARNPAPRRRLAHINDGASKKPNKTLKASAAASNSASSAGKRALGKRAGGPGGATIKSK